MVTTGYKSYALPDHLIDPSTKGPEWGLAMFKAIHNEWQFSNTHNSFAHGVERYRKNRLYALGRQSNAEYKMLFQSQDDPNTSYMNIDWTVPPMLPKARRIVLERIAKLEYDLYADAVDPLALADKDRYEDTEKANIMLRQALGDEVDTSVLNSGEVDQPMTEKELAMRMMFSYKHNQAMDVEVRTDAVLQRNKFYDQILPRIREDLFDWGVAVIRDDYDPITGEVIVRRCDPKNIIVSPTQDPFFGDMTYCGEIVYLTIGDIRRHAKGKYTEEQLQNLVDKYRGLHGNPQYFGDPSPFNQSPYDDVRIPVLDLQFKSVNREVYERRVDKRGNKVVGRASFKELNYSGDRKEVVADDMYCWYEGKWVIGSEQMLSFNRVANEKRKISALVDSIPSFHIVSPGIFEMKTWSPVDELIPIVDKAIIAWYKLQNVIVKARPKGLAIEIGALENVSLGTGYENLQPIQVEEIFDATGNLYYRRMDPSGNMISTPAPITELNNGLGQEAEQHFNAMMIYVNQIKDALGLNDFTDASTPNPKSLNGVAAMAIDSSQNAINYIARAERDLAVRVAESVAIRVHDAIAFKKTTAYDHVLSPQSLKSIRENRDQIYREFAIIVQPRGTQQERERIDMDMEVALKNGQITIADKAVIRNIRNVKQAEMMLAYLVERNEEARKQEQLAMVQKTSEEQIKAAQAAEQARQATLKIETDEKIRYEQAVHQLKMRELTHEYSLRGGTEINRERTKGQALSEVEDKKTFAGIEKANIAANAKIDDSLVKADSAEEQARIRAASKPKPAKKPAKKS